MSVRRGRGAWRCRIHGCSEGGVLVGGVVDDDIAARVGVLKLAVAAADEEENE